MSSTERLIQSQHSICRSAYIYKRLGCRLSNHYFLFKRVIDYYLPFLSLFPPISFLPPGSCSSVIIFPHIEGFCSSSFLFIMCFMELTLLFILQIALCKRLIRILRSIINIWVGCSISLRVLLSCSCGEFIAPKCPVSLFFFHVVREVVFICSPSTYIPLTLYVTY